MSASRRIDRYELGERLAEGGFGDVYRAQHVHTRRHVALKLLRVELSRDPQMVARFEQEAQALAAIENPHVVQVLDWGCAPSGECFLVTELCEGRDLRALLAERGALDVEEALGIAQHILIALDAAHQRGVVHRDLKPRNVFVVDGDRKAMLIDFGVSLAPEQRDALRLGTPGYMAPEQVRGAASDVRTDVYGAAVVIYEMLTGRRPHDAKNYADYVVRVCTDPPADIRALRPDLTEAVAHAIMRALAIDPAERPASARAFAAALGITSNASSITPSDPKTMVLAPSTPPARRLHWWAAAAALVACLAAALLLWLGRERTALELASGVSPKPAAATLLELPVRGSAHDKAIAAYQRGIAAMHDAAWSTAQPHFERAIELDPDFAEAHLRLAMLSVYQHGPEKRRAIARRAVALRHELATRDRLLLSTLEPLLLPSAPEPRAFRERIDAMIAIFPRDAELRLLGAVMYLQPEHGEEGVAHARRAVEIDPQYADAWNALGRLLGTRGQREEAIDALSRCVKLSPVAQDCLLDRAALHAALGRCEAALGDARDATSVAAPGGRWPQYAYLLAASPTATKEAVDTVLRNEWDGLGGGELVWVRREIYFGDFVGAEARLDKLRSQTGVQHDAERMYGELLLETGRAREAAEAARAALERIEAMSSGPTVWPGHDVSLILWSIRERAGEASAAEVADARSSFAASWGKRGLGPWELWRNLHGETVVSADEARDALGKLKNEKAMLDVSALRWSRSRFTSVLAHAGHVHLLAGKHAEALARLEQAAATCPSFDDPFVHVHLFDWLGQAREATGKDACGAYRRVLDRWGAVPKSVTAAHARQRRAALRCTD